MVRQDCCAKERLGRNAKEEKAGEGPLREEENALDASKSWSYLQSPSGSGSSPNHQPC